MPIEIRELVIKATVEPSVNNAQPSRGTATRNGTATSINAEQLETIISEVVERVMDALKQQNER